MNPFETPTTSVELIKQDILSLDVGESKQVNLDGKTIENYRATLHYALNGTQIKARTRVSKHDGSLWIQRTK